MSFPRSSRPSRNSRLSSFYCQRQGLRPVDCRPDRKHTLFCPSKPPHTRAGSQRRTHMLFEPCRYSSVSCCQLGRRCKSVGTSSFLCGIHQSTESNSEMQCKPGEVLRAGGSKSQHRERAPLESISQVAEVESRSIHLHQLLSQGSRELSTSCCLLAAVNHSSSAPL